MIKAAVVGATGYVGQELIRLLYQHPNIDLKIISSRKNINERYDSIYGNYVKRSELKFSENDLKYISQEVDVLFLALPHGVASNLLNDEVLSNTKVIDMGADFRLNDVNIYENWYGTEHGNPSYIKKSIYGLCELKRDEIKNYSLIANPGCYTTCSILSLAPIIKEEFINNKSIVIDAKSGVTGAGRSLNMATHYTECNESIKAYKIASHRHTPEIEEQLGSLADENINLIFTPHLVPMNRGILTTSYIKLTKDIHIDDIYHLYRQFYKKEYFIRLLNKDIYPETRWVKGSNYCDLGINLDKRTNTLVIVGAIDNLIKGAAGQAVQNMNIIFNFDETCGLKSIPIFPV
ncbi:MAG: N-acetyl-gamma-glutamyl-phosphate reductase [Eubacteriaceae bacterium]